MTFTRFPGWRLLAMLLATVAGLSAQAQTPLQDYFRNPKFASATLSPNGKYLATTANIDGRMQLAVVNLEDNSAKNVAGYDKLDIVGVRWINDERMTFSIVARDGEQRSSASGLFAINRDGSKDKTLMDSWELLRGRIDHNTWVSEPRGMTLLEWNLADNPNDVIAIGYFPNGDAVPYRVDTITGKRKEIDYNLNGLARGFVTDHTHRIRVVVTTNAERSVQTIWYREAEGKPWRALLEQKTTDARLSVLGFDGDNTTMLVAARTSGSRWGVHKFDFTTNQPGELLASDPRVDVDGGLVFAPDGNKLLGIRVESNPPRTVWLDKSMAGLQAGIDKAFSGLINVIYPAKAQTPVMIYSYSSAHPGQYSLYHPDKKKLQGLFSRMPWIDPKKMSTQLVADYVARDGLQIPAYLSLPPGREIKNLPLVVLVHGGPWGRDHVGFNSEVQFLTGMGYAVLQPQFRGSTGFGEDHLKKSFGQWGLAMQDDVTDGVKQLVKEAIVDPKRVCIMGASYGGYATMQGLVKDPDLYRCGVNLLGVTNIFYISSSGDWGDRAAVFAKDIMIGDPGKLKDQFNATSPSKNADKIKAPVFMVYGEKDYRVPLVHGEDMRDGLKKHGKVYEYMELEKEEHGIASEENRYKVFGAIEAFLRKHNPPQ